MKTSDYIRLKVEWDFGQAAISFTPAFDELEPLLRADVLKDLLYDIAEQYNKALLDFRNEWLIAQMKQGRIVEL